MNALKKILDDIDEVDLTPMIDVTFLLLIYFMVTTMLKQPEAELSIQLPGKPKSSDITPMEMLNVRIGEEGQGLFKWIRDRRWNGLGDARSGSQLEDPKRYA